MKLAWVAAAPGLRLDHETIWPLVGAGGVVLAHLAGDGLLPCWPCPFKAITGRPCPGCGGTRALLALAHLDVAAAFAWNPLVAAGGALLAAFSAYAIVALALRLPRLRLVSLSAGERVAAVVAVLVNWAYLIGAGR